MMKNRIQYFLIWHIWRFIQNRQINLNIGVERWKILYRILFIPVEAVRRCCTLKKAGNVGRKFLNFVLNYSTKDRVNIIEQVFALYEPMQVFCSHVRVVSLRRHFSWSRRSNRMRRVDSRSRLHLSTRDAWRTWETVGKCVLSQMDNVLKQIQVFRSKSSLRIIFHKTIIEELSLSNSWK